MITKFEYFSEETTFSEIYPKNKWVQLTFVDKDYLKYELYSLIHNAYSPLGGHVRIVKPESIITDKNLTYWNAADVDFDPESDVVIFGRKTKHGIKISGWGHDGEKVSRQELVKRLSSILKRSGYFIEVSGRPAELLLRNDVPIANKESIKMVFPDSEFTWYSDGSYKRTLGSNKETDVEFLLGRPNI